MVSCCQSVAWNYMHLTDTLFSLFNEHIKIIFTTVDLFEALESLYLKKNKDITKSFSSALIQNSRFSLSLKASSLFHCISRSPSDALVI